MRGLCSLTFFLFYFSVAFGQDVIFLNNGDEITGKVTEITLDLVKYSKEPDGSPPIYSIRKNEVFMIKYENGYRDMFQDSGEDNVKTSTSIIDASRIETEKIFGGYKFLAEGKVLTLDELSNKLKGSPEASQLFEEARKHLKTANILNYTGYGFVLLSGALFLATNTFQITLPLIAVGLGIGALIKANKFNNMALTAVRIYNDRLAFTPKKEVDSVLSMQKTQLSNHKIR